MTVQDISELFGWRLSTGPERRYIEDIVKNENRKDANFRAAMGILCLVFGFFVFAGWGALTLKGQQSSGMLVFLEILGILAFFGGISLLIRAGKNKAADLSARLQNSRTLEAFCIQSDHRVDGNSVSLIRVRDASGQECLQWLKVPRSLARSFDAMARQKNEPAPVFPVLIVIWEDQYRVFRESAIK